MSFIYMVGAIVFYSLIPLSTYGQEQEINSLYESIPPIESFEAEIVLHKEINSRWYVDNKAFNYIEVGCLFLESETIESNRFLQKLYPIIVRPRFGTNEPALVLSLEQSSETVYEERRLYIDERENPKEKFCQVKLLISFSPIIYANDPCFKEAFAGQYPNYVFTNKRLRIKFETDIDSPLNTTEIVNAFQQVLFAENMSFSRDKPFGVPSPFTGNTEKTKLIKSFEAYQPSLDSN